jgi:hypothetical protein
MLWIPAFAGMTFLEEAKRNLGNSPLRSVVLCGMRHKRGTFNIDGFVKSPSTVLRCTSVIAAYEKVRLIPSVLRALYLELFTLPSNFDFLRLHQYLI